MFSRAQSGCQTDFWRVAATKNARPRCPGQGGLRGQMNPAVRALLSIRIRGPDNVISSASSAIFCGSLCQCRRFDFLFRATYVRHSQFHALRQTNGAHFTGPGRQSPLCARSAFADENRRVDQQFVRDPVCVLSKMVHADRSPVGALRRLQRQSGGALRKYAMVWRNEYPHGDRQASGRRFENSRLAGMANKEWKVPARSDIQSNGSRDELDGSKHLYSVLRL